MAEKEERLTSRKTRPGISRLARQRNNGRVLELDDRTRWEIQPGNEVFTAHWAPSTKITIVPGSYEEWPFDLINTDSGDRVPARHQPTPGNWLLAEEPPD